jgi:hypothetical protein
MHISRLAAAKLLYKEASLLPAESERLQRKSTGRISAQYERTKTKRKRIFCCFLFIIAAFRTSIFLKASRQLFAGKSTVCFYHYLQLKHQQNLRKGPYQLTWSSGRILSIGTKTSKCR